MKEVKEKKTPEVALLVMDDELRGKVLDELEPTQKRELMENLVEYAMTLGLMEPAQVNRWIGAKGYSIKWTAGIIKRIKDRWIEETSDVFKYAHEQRAIQMQKAWKEVQHCEMLYKEAKSVGDKVRVKGLLLQWMQYISKLSFVEKLVEASEPDMSIVINSGVTKAEEVLDVKFNN